MIFVACAAITPVNRVWAQPSRTSEADAAVLYVDGIPVNWQDRSSFHGDSVDTVARSMLEHLREEGRLFAEVDSIVGRAPVRVYVTAGPELTIRKITFTGDPALSSTRMLRLMETHEGGLLRERLLEEDIRFLLEEHNRVGWPLAQASVEDVKLFPGTPGTLSVTIRIDRGEPVILQGIELPGAERTRSGYISRLTGLRVGRRLAGFDGDEIRRRILATNYFREVGEPRLELRSTGEIVAVIPLTEEAPGNFDLALGYIPKASSTAGGGVVGNGRLELRNLFGGGRIFNLRLNRLPGRVSSVDAGIADPNIAGVPIGIEATFHGVQQDSTYDQQQYAGTFTYEVREGMRLLAGVTREVTKPGQAGLQFRARRQRIPQSTASFLGVGVRYEAVDWPVNPRRGFRVESLFERGNKDRTSRIIDAEGDTLTSRSRVNQERLSVSARYFLPTLGRQLVVIGADAQLVLSNDYDESDLIRLGGARSLRGYNEEQFLGRLAGRFLIEYRYQVDRYSFAYGFTDVGFLETAPENGTDSRREILPGFGIGMQFRTEVGIINVSYAFNDEDGPIDGRVHVGLSFSL